MITMERNQELKPIEETTAPILYELCDSINNNLTMLKDQYENIFLKLNLIINIDTSSLKDNPKKPKEISDHVDRLEYINCRIVELQEANYLIVNTLNKLVG